MPIVAIGHLLVLSRPFSIGANLARQACEITRANARSNDEDAMGFEIREFLAIHGRVQRSTVIAECQTTVGKPHGPARARTDDQCNDTGGQRFFVATKSGRFAHRDAIGHEHDRPRLWLASKHVLCQSQGSGRSVSRLGHHLRIESLQEDLQHAGIIGQRHDAMRRTRIGDQSRTCPGSQFDEIQNLLLGTLQSRRRDIGREHARRNLEGDHDRCGLGEKRWDLPTPGGPGSSDRT